MAFAMTLPSPLNAQQNAALALAMQSGNPHARDELVEGNMRLVTYSAGKFKNTGIDLDDLISVGSIGLMKAIDSFNLDKNIKFATYASRCIDNEILMLLRKNKKHKNTSSLDDIVGTDSEGKELTLMQLIPDDSIEDLSTGILDNELQKEFHSLMSKLPELERKILHLRYFQEKTQYEVSELLQFSQSYVSRLEKKSIDTMRKATKKIEEDFEKELTNQNKMKRGITTMAAAGDRTKAINLLKETRLTYRQISDETGVPKGTVGILGGKYRPKEVRDSLKEQYSTKKTSTLPEREIITNSTSSETKVISNNALRRIESAPEAIKEAITNFTSPETEETPILRVNQEELIRQVVAAKTTEALDKVEKEVQAFVKQNPPTLGDALQKFYNDVKDEVKSEMIEPTKGIISKKLTVAYEADGQEVSTQDFITEMRSLLHTLEESRNPTINFNVSIKAF